MDVIIPHNTSSYWECNELRYCLRALETNFMDLRDIYIVGDSPAWTKKVINFPAEDVYKNNKGACIINKILSSIDAKFISDDFLFCSDDQIMLKPMFKEDIHPYYTYDLIGNRFNGYNKFWKKCLVNTRRALRKEKLPCLNYETHTPKIINKSLFKSVMDKYDWVNVQYPTHSLYFNNIIKNPIKMPDNYRAFFNQEGMDLSVLDNKSFLGFNDIGLSWKLQNKLEELFPYKSRYEK